MATTSKMADGSEAEPLQTRPGGVTYQPEDFGPITFEHFTSNHPSISPLSIQSAEDTVEPSGSNGFPHRCSSAAAGSSGEVLTIHCGGLAAKLHTSRFLCPGIHQLCVEYNGEMITPKQFTVISAKDKQKDWKGAIKLNRQPLRVLFERQRLDFYRHPEFCSGRCVSKNNRIWVPDGPETNSPTSPVQYEFGRDVSSGMSLIGHMRRSIGDADEAAQTVVVIKEEPQTDLISQESSVIVTASFATQQSSLPVTLAPPTATVIPVNNTTATEPILTNAAKFWMNVEKVGLFQELMTEIISAIRTVESEFINKPQLKTQAAQKLSELVKVLGIEDSIDRQLVAKRSQMRTQTAILSTEIEELKRKTQEQKRRQLEIKRKAEIFDELVGLKKPRRPDDSNPEDADV